MAKTKNTKNNPFALLVKTARTKSGMSQSKLGAELRTTQRPEGVWNTYVGQIEKGQRIPSDEVCVKLAEALNLAPLSVLFSAYEARAESSSATKTTKDLFKMMKRALMDPVIQCLLTAKEPLDEDVLKALEDEDIRGALGLAIWREAIARSFRIGKKRDIPGLLAMVEAMDDKQWMALIGMVETWGLKS